MEKPFLEMMNRYSHYIEFNCSFNFVDAVIASTADGVPLMRCTCLSQNLTVVTNPNSDIDIGSEEVEFPVCLSIVADHVVVLFVCNVRHVG